MTSTGPGPVLDSESNIDQREGNGNVGILGNVVSSKSLGKTLQRRRSLISRIHLTSRRGGRRMSEERVV